MATKRDTISTLQSAAAELADSFTSLVLDNGDSRVILKDGAAEWIKEAIHAAHGDLFPDDYVYRTCQRVADSIVDYARYATDPGHGIESLWDMNGEIVDGLVDVYTRDLLAWLASNLTRPSICDEAAEELGLAEDADLMARITLGQYREIDSIFSALLSAIESHIAE